MPRVERNQPAACITVALTLCLSAGLALAGTPAPAGSTSSDAGDARNYTCIDGTAGTGCPDLQKRVSNGGTVWLPKGIYRQCAVIRKDTVLFANGSLFDGAICQGKATFVQDANFVLKDAECANVHGQYGNEACLRREKGRTRLEHVHFHDSYNGILGGTGEPLIIKDSLLERLGGAPSHIGRAHGIYMKDGMLTLRRTTIRAAQWKGHLVKTGGVLTIIEDSTLDERGGDGSRILDAFNGGDIVIRNSRLIAAPGDGNSTVIGYDYEARRSLARNRISLRNSSVDCAGGHLVQGRNSFDELRVEEDLDTTLRNCR